MTSTPSGDFVVVWEVGTPPTNRVLARRFAGTGSPLGGEFRVDTSTTGSAYLFSPHVAANSSGFVVTWQEGNPGSNAAFARRYSSSGAALGGPFRLGTFTSSAFGPDVAVDSLGDFVLAYSSSDGSPSQVRAQRYSPSGSALGAEFQIYASTTSQFTPHVAGGAAGGFFVVWGPGMHGRFFSFDGEPYTPTLDFPGFEAGPWQVAGDALGHFVAIGEGIDPDTLTFSAFAQRLAEPPDALGTEATANVSTASIGVHPRVAQNPDGSFVVVWTDVGALTVEGRRFDAAGKPKGFEFRVNSAPTNWSALHVSQYAPAVAPLAGGGFIVAWQDFGNDGAGEGISARRFDASGAPLTADFHVNAFTTLDQLLPSIASDATGEFVVAWAGPAGGAYAIFAQRYASSGLPAGSQFRVSTYTSSGSRSAPAVARDGAGNFLVAWEDSSQDGAGFGVYMRRYASAGAPVGGEVRVNTGTSGNQRAPRIGMNGSGDFVISFTSDAADGAGTAVLAQRYSSAGAALGAPFQANTYTTGDQIADDVALNAAGDFTIVWHSGGDGSGTGVFGQRYKKTGESIGAEFLVNSYTTGSQQNPAVAFGGRFVVAWNRDASAGPPAGVSVRVFESGLPGNVNGDSVVDVSDVFYLVNYLFAGGQAPVGSGDANGDGMVDVADVFYLINYLFAGGPPPV
jgi:hypothetical protein